MGWFANVLNRLVGKSCLNSSGDGARKLISIVLLLRKPCKITEAEFRVLFSTALGVTLGSKQTDSSIFVEFQPGMFGIKTRGLRLGMMLLSQRYTRDQPSNSDDLDFRVRNALKEHQAWMAIDAMGDLGPDQIDRAYSLIGKLLAEVIEVDPGNVLGVYSTQIGRLVHMYPELPEKLRLNKPLDALKSPDPPVVQVAAGDPEMEAATAEARRRWPEFVEAFASRSRGNIFSIKVPIGNDGAREFIWINPTAIIGDQITGRLANVPAHIPGLKIDDKVTVPLSDLNDWIFKTSAEMVGGFTVKVLTERRRK